MRVTLRLPEELHQRLEARSRAAGVSLNQTIVSTLRKALARAERARSGDVDDRTEQLRHIRVALGDLVVELDESELPPELRPGDDLPDVDALRESMPRLEPPLSRTIIEDRADRV